MGLLISGAEGGNEYARSYIERNQVPLDHPWFWQAFIALGSERKSLGMGIGAIPDSAVRAYAKDERLSPCEKARLLYIIRAVDNHVLRKFAEQQDKASRKAK